MSEFLARKRSSQTIPAVARFSISRRSLLTHVGSEQTKIHNFLNLRRRHLGLLQTMGRQRCVFLRAIRQSRLGMARLHA